jgi:hypothetical protein
MTGRGSRFDHAALILESEQTVERLLVPMLSEHVQAGEPVLMVVGKHTEEAVRERLRGRADALEWGAAGSFYQRLGFTFEGFRRYLATQHAQRRRIHVVAEPDLATDLSAPVDRVAAYLTYESMCNEALAGYGCPVTCIWDARRHPTLVIEGVRSIHNHELTVDGRMENPSFISPTAYLSGRADVAMSELPEILDLEATLKCPDVLDRYCETVDEWAGQHSFGSLARHQVVTATREVIINGMRHGEPPVRLRCWCHGRTLVVQVDDEGARDIPADAGYRPPGHPLHTGGMWIARQFADVLTTYTDERRTAVRMYFPFGVTHRQLMAKVL